MNQLLVLACPVTPTSSADIVANLGRHASFSASSPPSDILAVGEMRSCIAGVRPKHKLRVSSQDSSFEKCVLGG